MCSYVVYYMMLARCSVHTAAAHNAATGKYKYYVSRLCTRLIWSIRSDGGGRLVAGRGDRPSDEWEG